MMQVTEDIFLDDAEIELRFIRSSGPGGQNVNKVATAAQLRFDVAASPSLPDDVRRRLTALAGSRITVEGVLVLTARRFRSQEKNREDAVARLADLVRRAAEPPRPRHETKPTRGSKERRLESKRRRSVAKRRRAAVRDVEE